uniref:Restriction endonuclease type IV Mrr domain-containing protein n=1 Tax=Archaeoglobus fulgidus TaxID=2234 RepID=A0A7J2TGX6_ARCFL
MVLPVNRAKERYLKAIKRLGRAEAYYECGKLVYTGGVKAVAECLKSLKKKVPEEKWSKMWAKVYEETKIIERSREILEDIVAEALKSLGFDVKTDEELPAKGRKVEVDVWAVKYINGAPFRIYASCKNWSKEVDVAVIDQEIGRVQRLCQPPHLKILVAKSLTKDAKETALSNEFLVIELEKKASAENAEVIRKVVYDKLRKIVEKKIEELLEKEIKEIKKSDT